MLTPAGTVKPRACGHIFDCVCTSLEGHLNWFPLFLFEVEEPLGIFNGMLADTLAIVPPLSFVPTGSP
jgi:hypothetical protein